MDEVPSLHTAEGHLEKIFVKFFVGKMFLSQFFLFSTKKNTALLSLNLFILLYLEITFLG